MSFPPTSVGHHMSRSLHSVEPSTPAAEAFCLMRDQNIRHLPVIEDGALVGMLSQRDLRMLGILQDVASCELPVEDLMETEVYRVKPTAELAVVAEEMAERKIGSAVVGQGDGLLGLFTTTDALRVLAERMRALA